MDDTVKRALHVRGRLLEFENRDAPFQSTAGIRFLREHEGAIAAGLTAGLDALPPGVLGELMRLLLAGPHEFVDWERDVPAFAVLTIIAASSLPGDAENTQE